jgi:hypothetical protein
VMGIRDRHPELIAGEKKDLSRLAGRFIKLGLERLVEAVGRNEIPAAQLSVPLGIISDKKLLWDGEATSRIEHASKKEIDPSDVSALLEQLKRTSIQVESTSLKNIPSESTSEENPQNSQQIQGIQPE